MAASAAFAACAVTTETVAVETGWRIEISAPCRPYTPVRIAYGPLAWAEETGVRGGLSLTLPRLNGKEPVWITGFETPISVTPPRQAATGFLWIDSDLHQPGLLPGVGLPAADDRAQPELALYPSGQTPAVLNLPITEDRCGGPLRFALMRDGWEAPRDVAIDLPDCAMAGAVIQLQLPTR